MPWRWAAAGSYRVFADFSTNETARTLGGDLTVDGEFDSNPLPAPTDSVTDDGLKVALTSGDAKAGREAELDFEVTRDGKPVDVQPYLGARGHLVALREGDAHGAAWPEHAYVHADRQRLVQVLLNLLSNAIKYNRPGGTVRLGVAAGDDGRWAVRVEDSGRGIPTDRIGQLFTPFSRLGAELTDVEGTGLGLALSQRLCEAMGGALRLESTGAAGSVFRVELTGERRGL